jgi:hypothetical protein
MLSLIEQNVVCQNVKPGRAECTMHNVKHCSNHDNHSVLTG